jgi:hypothetical protein
MTFQEACQAILDDPKANPQALDLAKLARNEQHDALRVQAMYILSNLSHWRAPEAKEVRATLRLIGGVK